MLDEVAILRSRAETTFTTASLSRVRRDWRALDVTTVRDCDRHVFIGDEIFDRELNTFVDNLRPALVTEIFPDFLELFRDDASQGALVAENLFELGDVLDHLL